MLWRTRVLAASLSLLATATGGLLVAGPVHAQTVTNGTLSFSGDSGDYISQGESYSYSTSNGDALSDSGSPSLVSVSVNAYNGDWWTLDIDAPTGSSLAPGTYSAAHRYPFNGTGPGLSLSGNGRGCNTLTGSFTVIDAVFGTEGYVQTFDATFVQHCEGGTSATTGQVHISNPPQPAGPAAPTPAAGTGGHAAASSGSSAAAVGGSGASSSTGASGGNHAASSSTGVGSAADGISARPAAAIRRTVSVPILIAVALGTWIVLVAIALGVGLGLPVRRR